MKAKQMNSIQKEIYTYILSQLSENKLSVGDKILTENDLAQKFNTGRMNAHLAVKELELDGIVKRNKRQGTIVTKKKSEVDISGLKSAASNIVFVMASPLNERFNIHWNESTLLTLETTLNEKGFRAHHMELPGTRKLLNKCFQEISRQDSKALIILPGKREKCILDNIDCLSQYSGNIIILNRGTSPFDRFPYHSIGFSPYQDGVVAGEYLLQNNRTNIAYIGYLSEAKKYYWIEQRYEGLKFALQHTHTLKCCLADDQYKTGAAALKEIKKSSKKITIVAGNDAVAARIIDFAKEHGIHTPDDFFIMGFNNIFEFRAYNITSVATAIDKVGVLLAEISTTLLPYKIEDTNVNIYLKPRVIIKETC